MIRISLAAVIAAALLVFAAPAFAAPLIFEVVLGGKYPIDSGLIVASLAIGLAKLWEGFSTTVVSACGSANAMALISAHAWICLGTAAAGAIIGSRFGLLGILWGVGLGWMLLAAGGTYLALISVRQRFAMTPTVAG